MIGSARLTFGVMAITGRLLLTQKDVGMTRTRTQRTAAAVLITVALAGSAGACSDNGGNATGSSGGSSTFSVSLIGDLSGPYGTYVGPGVTGFQTAIKAINAAGGVNGKQIKVNSPLDAQSTTAAAQVAVRQAVGQKPIAVLMSTASTEVIANSSVLGGAGITSLIVPNDDAQAVPPKDYYYSATLSSVDAGNAYVNAMKADLGDLGGKKIALITSNAASATAYGVEVQKLVEGEGGTVTTFIKNDPTVSSFTSQAGQIMKDRPDAIMQTDSPTNTAVEVKALVDAGYTGPIYGGTAANDDATLKKTAEEGGDYRGPRELNTPAEGDAVMTAAEKYGTADQAKSAGIYFSKGWALAYALKAGLEKCGSGCTAAKLPAAMKQVSSLEIPGNITFGAAGFSDKSHVLLQEVQFYKWDTSAGKAVEAGDPIATSDD
jgi:ABC-type branched-subunit amino acid transport system substrate-binding protein